ncbi:hypothetical protein MRS76_12065 [Rhizobiaceae bacterium n13]|uniref:Uncharacterized protein n=1 Tax=Ferirhizobium litorale TaxID=2927786 RepID=A0AAE3QIQ5_9HYPH|nr:hypothetical protein [Fererhizobium litorale]MDI7862694.1 hypothetical protein [Fererhizobium litorale]MDI7923823.1 hypothetical protein [Fererhizobium litorale]
MEAPLTVEEDYSLTPAWSVELPPLQDARRTFRNVSEIDRVVARDAR